MRASAGDLARDEGLAAYRCFVIEQDAVEGVHVVRLTVIHGDPVRVELGHRIRAARVERGSFLLRYLLHQAIKFGG